MSTFLRWYNYVLKNYPRITNAISTGVLFGTGDFIAQQSYYENKDRQEYDFPRTIRSLFYGSFISSLICDKWFKFLDNKVKIPNQLPNSHLNSMLRVVIDQLCFAPLGIPLYFSCMTLLEGKDFNDASARVEKNWWSTLKANYTIWPAVQALNFSLVPVHHRLLIVNLVAIFWNTYISYKNSNVENR